MNSPIPAVALSDGAGQRVGRPQVVDTSVHKQIDSEACPAEQPVDGASPNAAPGTGSRRIIAFLCRECAYAAADGAGNARLSLPPTIRTVMVPCTGRVAPLHIVSALASGADGVYVAGCLEGQCHYRVGNLHAQDRVALVRRLLGAVGVEPERVAMFTMSAADFPRFAATARRMDETIAKLPRLARAPHQTRS
ncbi:MAG TPA: hydrogenase iron-sulfur subunit [Candidatus Binatia bacterium]|nr:hydrogenase iron-sulfur subunit [Candidatus Binatia bacterium]